MNFIPLNVFSNYAMLKSALTLDEYFTLLKKRKITTAGLSDPDFLFGYPHFNKLAKIHDIKPLYGVRLTLLNSEVVFFVKNAEGYKDLMAIFELHFNNEITEIALKEYTSNIITIIPSNNVITNNLNKADYRDYFKRWAMMTSDFYIGLETETVEINNVLREFAASFNYATVAFPLIKYVAPEDAKTLAMIDAIRDANVIDINATYSGKNYFLMDEELHNFYLPEELANTLKIAYAISFVLDEKHTLNLPLPAAYNPDEEIERLTMLGLETYGVANDKRYTTRLRYELDIIKSLNFTNYFLIVSDYVQFAKDNNILVGYGRGSAPGSLVSYALGITMADPIKYDLLFERFLNPARISMPDIDIDFMDTRRNEVIDYIKKTYGDNHVAQIVTFQTNAAKASLRDTGRIFNIDNKFINILSKSLGNSLYSLRESYKKVPAFRKLIDADKFNLEIIKHAVKLEGFPRQSGMHAAGLIIDGKPLPESLPTFKHNDTRITQYEMGFLEAQGFLKVDILGLSNLTFIDNIIKRVNDEEHKALDFYKLSFDDPRIYDVIQNGHTLGLFQLESDGMRRAIREIKPTNFDDVSALLALYRPGPMQYISDYAAYKNKTKTVTYINDDFAKILAPTYGIMIYQEQIMQIAAVMANFNLAEADLLRRAISKKDEAIILEQKAAFLKGAQNKGYTKIESEKVFSDILRFADYGFNKSHSVVYAMITMALAYLKTYHPAAFFSELLPSIINDTKKFQQARDELKALNLKLLAPNIHQSTLHFNKRDDGLLMPFTSIIGINNETARILVNLRSEAPFSSVQNFFYRAYDYGIKQDEIIALIEAGALDDFNTNRAYLMNMFNTYLPTLETRLFASEDALNDIIVTAISENETARLDAEVMRLRFPLSPHPISTMTISGFQNLHSALSAQDTYIKTFGILTMYREIKTKKGDVMAFATLSDYQETLSLVIFPSTLAALAQTLEKDAIYLVTGKIEIRDNEKQLVISTIERYHHE